WLTGRLAPDFKTIANFRKDNGKAIRNVSREFVLLCKKLDLFTEALVAIDGSKFKAVNNRDRNVTDAKMARRIRDIETSIHQYLTELDTADRQEPEIAQLRKARLQDKITALKREMQSLQDVAVQLQEAPDGQISLTDPDCRSMKTRGTGMVGYNVQSAVDAKHHLIVTHEVTNIGSDREQLLHMAERARQAIGVEQLTVVADRGYFKSEEILACDQAGITTIVAKSDTSTAKAEGRFCKEDFIYDAQNNEYRCPAGQRLIWRYATIERDMKLHRYWSSNCKSCPLKKQCTPGPQRRITRWEHEEILEAMQTRLDRFPQAMRIRRQTVEHPFGTIKLWMGSAHFLMKTLKHVKTEMSLHVLAYNLKRVMKIMGLTALMQAMRA
ncbi:MAG: IS1182 family transposase, partial [Pseudomonadota bacterium]